MATAPKIALPENLPATTVLKLQDGLDPNKNSFVTQVKGDKTQTLPAVEALLVDHGLREGDKGGLTLRCLFLVLKGKALKDSTGAKDVDVAGRHIVTDLNLVDGTKDNSWATIRLMGLDMRDVDAANEALARTPGDAAALKGAESAKVALLTRFNNADVSGAQTKRLQVKVAAEMFLETEQWRVPLGGITQFAATVSGAEAALKLGDIMSTIAASKNGAPRRDAAGGAGGNAGTRQPRPPTSKPPVVEKGEQAPDDFTF